jgi:hypothetical protein
MRPRSQALISNSELTWLAKVTQLQAVATDTRRNQLGTWQRFKRFSTHYALSPIASFVLTNSRVVPVVNPDAIVKFMVDYCIVKKNSPSSLEGELTRIKRHARQALHVIWPDQLPFPDGGINSFLLRDTMMSLKKNFAKPPKQKIPIRLSHILKMVKICDISRLSHLEAITRFLISNVFCLRCSSAIKLLARHVQFKSSSGWRRYSSTDVDNLTFPSDDKGQSVIWCRIQLHNEKNNKGGPARVVTLPPWVHSNVCAGTTLYNWLVRSKPRDDQTVFARFSHGRRHVKWTYNTAMRQILLYASRIGLPAAKIGMHSLRRAGVCDYVHAGKLIPFIISIGGWRSLAFLTYFFADEHLLTTMSNRQSALTQQP